MVIRVRVEDGITRSKFRRDAKFFLPNQSMILTKKGKPIARFSSKTRRVSKV